MRQASRMMFRVPAIMLSLFWSVATSADAQATGGAAAPIGQLPTFSGCTVSADNWLSNIDGFAASFTTPLTGVMNIASGIAMHIFVGFACLECAWFAVTFFLQHRSLEEIFSNALLKIVSVGFFYSLVLSLGNAGGNQIFTVINNWGQLGTQVAAGYGGGGTMTAMQLGSYQNSGTNTPISTIIQHGLCLSNEIVSAPIQKYDSEIAQDPTTVSGFLKSLFGPNPVSGAADGISTIVMLFSAFPYLLVELGLWLLTLFVFVYIAAQLLIALFDSALIVSAGSVMLGFSGSRWTMPYAQGYLKYVMMSCVRLFSIYLVAGLDLGMISATVQGAANSLATSPVDPTWIYPVYNPKALAEIFAVTVFGFMLAKDIPRIAASMIDGGPAMSINHAIQSAMAGAAIASAPAAVATLAVGGVGMLGARVAAGGAASGAAGGAAAEGGAASAGSASTAPVGRVSGGSSTPPPPAASTAGSTPPPPSSGPSGGAATPAPPSMASELAGRASRGALGQLRRSASGATNAADGPPPSSGNGFNVDHYKG